MAIINVKLPDGTMQSMSHPDDWSRDQIQEAIHKQFNVPMQKKVSQPLQQSQEESSSYQDFMNPKKMDAEGKPMVETMLGRMPKEIPELRPSTTENKEILDEAINEAPLVGGLKPILEAPMKLSLKGIVKNIISEKNKEKLYHTGAYNNLWKAASNAGVNNVILNPNLIGLQALQTAKVNNKYIRPLQKLLQNPTLENAQTAQSDLGKLINSPQLSKEVLTSEENAAKDAAMQAQEHIRDMMFRDQAGNVNKGLKDEYTKISSSYAKNYKPYDITAIRKYEKGKMTAKQLIQKLKSGEFMAEKGEAHPEIDRRDFMLDILKNAGVPLTAGSIGVTGGAYLMNKLLGKND